jgi:uncharacterized protein (TIGR03067 family)
VKGALAMTEEMRELQGTWKQIAYEKDGSKEPQDELGWEPSVTFVGDTFTVTLADGTIVIEGTYRIDPTGQPRAIDWTDTFGADAGKTFPAIYIIEGDRLTFCAADDGEPRPTEFTTRPGQVLRVSQRVSRPASR